MQIPQDDKRAVESVVTLFARLVDNLRVQPAKLLELSAHNLLDNVQQLMSAHPARVSAQHVHSLLRMCRVMCARQPQLALQMLNVGYCRFGID